MHDSVGPFTADDGGNDVAKGGGDVEEAGDYDGEVVGRGREGLLHGDVEDEKRAEGNGGVVDGYGYRREAEVGKYGEGVDDEALED